jgi:hypothetical protein
MNIDTNWNFTGTETVLIGCKELTRTKKIILTDYELSDCCRIIELNGEYPGKASCLKQLSFCTADMHNPGYNYPCVVPINGFNYSFVKSIAFEVFNWEKFASITNCKSITSIGMYLNGKIDENELEIFAAKTKPIEKYEQASGIIGDTGKPLSEYVHLDIFTREMPYIIDNYKHTCNFKSDIMPLQVRVSTSSIQGYKYYPKVEIVLTIEEADEKKLCKDCKYYRDWVNEPPKCDHKFYTKKLVTGNVETTSPQCYNERYYGPCGHDGIFFEKKEQKKDKFINTDESSPLLSRYVVK